MAGRRKTDELKMCLRDAGLRATRARIAVLGCLVAAEGPMTHANVCDALSAGGYDRATLYRNLIDLTEVGLAHRNDLGDHLWRFELAEREHHEDAVHPHFVCSECGDVSCLPDTVIDFRSARGTPRAIRRGEVEVQVRGLCNACG